MNIETRDNPTNEWHYLYKNTVVIKIRQWSRQMSLFREGRQVCWNYYVGFNDKTCNAEVFNKLFDLTEDYYNEAFTPNHVHWHGGITFAESKVHPRFRTKTGDTRIIECGCDYQHSWDEGCTYDIDIVAAEAERTADELIALLNLKAFR